MRILFLSSLSLAILSCGSMPSSNVKDLSVQELKDVQIGGSKSEVIEKIGPASDSKIKPSEELWFYRDKEKLARATLSFDIQTQKLNGITIIPREDEKELNISYLKESKFPNGVFQKIPRLRCRRDYIPNEDFYIDIKQGIIIEFNSHRETVESYARTSHQQAEALAEKLKKCER